MRVHAHRGNTLAAGAVVLAAAVVEAELRAGPPPAVLAFLTLALAGITLVGALRSPVEEQGPRPYQELLLAIAALAGTATVAHLADLVGVPPGDPIDAAWVAGVAVVGAVTGLTLARLRGGTIVLGLGAVAAVVAGVAAVGAAWSGEDPLVGIRWALLVGMVVLVLSIVVRIDHRYQQAVALADVLAAAAVLLAGTFLVDGLPGATDALGLPGDGASAGLGWQLILLATGFGLAGMGATLHERGPGWLGALALVASLGVIARDGGGLFGWPVVLAVVGLVLVTIALRPASPREEIEDPEVEPPPPVPFPRRSLSAVPPVSRVQDAEDDLL